MGRIPPAPHRGQTSWWEFVRQHAGELIAEREHLGAELSVGAGADENQIGEEADELVHKAEKHGDRSCPIARRSAGETASSAQERYARAVLERANRTDSKGVTAQVREARPAGMPDLPELLRHPTVANRLRERWHRWEDLLAEAIAADVGASPVDPEPHVVAAALTGAIRVAAAAAWEQPSRRQEIAERVFDLLATGLSRYGAVPAVSRRRG